MLSKSPHEGNTRSELLRDVDELSDVHTKVLVMRELEGMSYREIGDKLGISERSAEGHAERMRLRWRRGRGT